MELSKDSFRKIILFSIVFSLLFPLIELLPIFSNYDNLEEQLHQGYLSQLMNTEVTLGLMVLVLITNLISLFLLYRFNPVGRPIYLLSYILMVLILVFEGDWIQYSLSYPLEVVGSFLEVFIFYLIYLSPLKEEFEKKII